MGTGVGDFIKVEVIWRVGGVTNEQLNFQRFEKLCL